MLGIFSPECSKQINTAPCLIRPAHTDLLLDHSHGDVLGINSAVLVSFAKGTRYTAKMLERCLCCAAEETCNT